MRARLRLASRRSRAAIWRLWLKAARPNVQIGEHLTLYGLPLLEIARTAQVTIGDNVVLISDPRFNLVGLSKRCSIYVGDHAVLSVGSGSGFSGVSIYCSRLVTIGRHVTCGGNVSIWDTDFHPLEADARLVQDRSQIRSAPIRIDDNAFIGANTIILKGAEIGEGAIIGAGSVVTRSVPAGEVWAGNPASRIARPSNNEPTCRKGDSDLG